MTDEIRSYGPGKFNTIVDQYVYAYETLTENGQAIYDAAVLRWRL